MGNLTPPGITGTAQVGQTLTVNPASTWSPVPSYLDTQWQNGTPPSGPYADISGATAVTYVCQVTDLGLVIRVGQVPVSGPPPPPPGATPWSPSSKMNTPIPPGTPYHANSANMIQNNSYFILPSGSPYANWIGPQARALYQGVTGGFGSLPAVTFTVNYSSGTTACGVGGTRSNVPWPSGFDAMLLQNDGGIPYYQDADGISYVFDTTSGDLYGGYRMSPPGYLSRNVSCPSGVYNAIVMTLFSGAMNGPGYDPTGLFFFASGSGIAAGLITPADMADLSASSVIPHRLRLDAPLQVIAGSGGGSDPGFLNGYVTPAAAISGLEVLAYPYGLPTGALIQLDPSLSEATIDSYLTGYPGTATTGLRGGLGKIARTLQTYGMVIVDVAGNAPGGGGIDCAISTLQGGNGYPWETGNTASVPSGWPSYSTALPASLYSFMHVIDWNVYT